MSLEGNLAVAVKSRSVSARPALAKADEVIGQLGDANDPEILQALSQSKEERLRNTAVYQLKELKRRLAL